MSNISNFSNVKLIMDSQKWVLFLQTPTLFSTTIYSIILNICFLRIITQTSLLQPNVKCYIINLTTAILIQCIYLIGQCCYNLVFYADFGWFDHLSCKIFQSFNLGTISATIFSMFVTSVDQFLLVFQIKQAKTRNSDNLSFWTGKIVMVIWLICIAQCCSMFTTKATRLQALNYCHFTFFTTLSKHLPVAAVLICIEVVGFFLYLIVYLMAKNSYSRFGSNTARHTLTQRFQLNQTMNATKSLLIWSFFQAVCYVISLSIRTTVLEIMNGSDKEMYVCICLIMCNLQTYSVFNAVHPILLIKLNPSLPNTVRKMYPRLCVLFFMKPKCFRNDVQHVKNVSSLVDYRLDPDKNKEIIEAIWTKKSGKNF